MACETHANKRERREGRKYGRREGVGQVWKGVKKIRKQTSDIWVKLCLDLSRNQNSSAGQTYLLCSNCFLDDIVGGSKSEVWQLSALYHVESYQWL